LDYSVSIGKHFSTGPFSKQKTKGQKLLSASGYVSKNSYGNSSKVGSAKKQRRDLCGHQVKLPPVTTSLSAMTKETSELAGLCIPF